MGKRKHKLEFRARSESVSLTGRAHKDWADFELTEGGFEVPVEDGEFVKVPVSGDMRAYGTLMDGAGWSDDPGTGKAVILPDGRELLNPLPVSPPAAIAALSKEPSVNDLVERALRRHFEQLKDLDEIDTLEEMDDFGEDDDYHPSSLFEVILRDEAPAVPKAAVPEEVKEDLDKLEEVASKVAPKKKGPPVVDPSEEE